jgi:hypothetical protein
MSGSAIMVSRRDGHEWLGLVEQRGVWCVTVEPEGHSVVHGPTGLFPHAGRLTRDSAIRLMEALHAQDPFWRESAAFVENANDPVFSADVQADPRWHALKAARNRWLAEAKP